MKLWGKEDQPLRRGPMDDVCFPPGAAVRDYDYPLITRIKWLGGLAATRRHNESSPLVSIPHQ